jgi:hypothetical protein
VDVSQVLEFLRGQLEYLHATAGQILVQAREVEQEIEEIIAAQPQLGRQSASGQDAQPSERPASRLEGDPSEKRYRIRR